MKLQRHAVFKGDGTPGKKIPDGEVYGFWCPGCEEIHIFTTKRDTRPVWTFNGDMDKPTFSPSLLYPSKTPRCHLFVQDGKIVYCQDCEHKLAGQTIDLPDIPPEKRW